MTTTSFLMMRMKRSRSRKSPRRRVRLRPARHRRARLRPAARRPKKSTFVRDDPVTEPERPAPSYAPRGDSRVTDKVVNLSNGKQLQVVLVAPTQFEAAREIADHLLRYHAVLINLEKADPAVARRLIDFLSGVAYAQEGDIRPAASKTYIITPRNVDLLGDQPDDMESGEFHL